MIKNTFLNILGKQISSKVVVLESDDWGTVRMSSQEAFQSLLKKGYRVDQCPYNTNDALESNQDLEMLFEATLPVTTLRYHVDHIKYKQVSLYS